MSGTDYRVNTRVTVEDQASAAFDKIASHADLAGSAMGALSGVAGGLAGAMDSVGSAAMMGIGALATAAAAGGIAAIKKGVVDVNANLEDTSIGFATLFNMMANTGIDRGMAMGKELMTGIRADAAALPGEFHDFVSMAQTLTGPLLQAGAGLQTIRDLTRDTVVSAAALKLPFDQAAREMAMLLQGHAGGHNVLSLKLGISTKTQVAGKDFAKATEAERLKFIQEKLAKAQDSLPLLSKSWSGLTSTMVDGVKALLGQATFPLFEKIKSQLDGINSLLGSPAARRLADVVGKDLVKGFDWVLDRITWVETHWDTISSSIMSTVGALKRGFEELRPLIREIGMFLGDKLKDPVASLKEFAAARVALGLVGNRNVTGAIGSVARNVAGAATTGFENVAGAATSAAADASGGTLAAVGSGAAAGLAELAAVAGPAAIAILAVTGAADMVTRASDDQSTAYGFMTDYGKGMWAEIKANWGQAWTELKATFDALLEGVRPLTDALGIGLMGAVDLAIYALRAILWPLRKLGEGLGWLANKLGYKSDGAKGGSPGDPFGGSWEQGTQWANGQSKATYSFDDKGNLVYADINKLQKPAATVKPMAGNSGSADFSAAELAAMAGKAAAAKGHGATHITNNVQLSVLRENDPERFARSVMTHLDKKMRNPTRPMGVSTMLQG